MAQRQYLSVPPEKNHLGHTGSFYRVASCLWTVGKAFDARPTRLVRKSRQRRCLGLPSLWSAPMSPSVYFLRSRTGAFELCRSMSGSMTPLGHDYGVAFDLIRPAGGGYRVEQVNTFGVRGNGRRRSFAIVAGKDKHSVSALRVYDMASRLLPEGVVNLACRYFFGALAGVLPHPNELEAKSCVGAGCVPIRRKARAAAEIKVCFIASSKVLRRSNARLVARHRLAFWR